jgi:hypothetical protein
MRCTHGWPEAEVASRKSERDEHHITDAAAQRVVHDHLLRSAPQLTSSRHELLAHPACREGWGRGETGASSSPRLLTRSLV